MVNMFQRQDRFVHSEGELNQIKATYPGMAHFAGTGKGDPCSKCAYFKATKKENGTCDKFKLLMKRKGESFPGKAISCRHFTDELTQTHNHKQEALL